MVLRQQWRRVLAGVGFVGALLLLTSRTCQTESARAEIHFRVGEEAALLRSVRGELFREDGAELIAFYDKRFDERGSGPTVGPWALRADPGVYRLELRIETTAGVRTATRSVDLVDGARITVDLDER